MTAATIAEEIRFMGGSGVKLILLSPKAMAGLRNADVRIKHPLRVDLQLYASTEILEEKPPGRAFSAAPEKFAWKVERRKPCKNRGFWG